MKFIASSTVLVTVLSLLATPSVEAANRHAGTRRQLDLHDGPNHTVGQVLQKRLPLSAAQGIEVGPKLRMLRRSSAMQRRQPEANPAFGAVPMMHDGTGHMVGLVQKRDDGSYAHNGQQGVAVSASSSGNGNNSTSSSDDISSSASTDDDDDEDCDDDDDEDTDDDDEDCDDEDGSDDSSATSTSSADGVGITASVAGISADVNINLKAKSSTSWAASSTSSSASSQSTEASSSASKGTGTWFTQNGVAGACGKVHQDSDHVIALYTSAYGSGSNCGRTVMIQNLDDGTSTTAVVADECPSCGGPEDIDLSVGTFSAIDPNYQNDGVRNIKWWFTS